MRSIVVTTWYSLIRYDAMRLMLHSFILSILLFYDDYIVILWWNCDWYHWSILCILILEWKSVMSVRKANSNILMWHVAQLVAHAVTTANGQLKPDLNQLNGHWKLTGSCSWENGSWNAMPFVTSLTLWLRNAFWPKWLNLTLLWRDDIITVA